MKTPKITRDNWVEVEVEDSIYVVGANTLEEGKADPLVITSDPVFGDWVVYLLDTGDMVYNEDYVVYSNIKQEATRHLNSLYWNE